MRRLFVVVVLAGCGDNRSLVTDASSDRSDAAICVTSCDDGNACTNDVCDEHDGCRHISLDRCAELTCALGACAGTDTDGDGLSDAWEIQGYVDVNCNGVNDGDGIDVELPGADPNVADVYVEIDYHEMAGSGVACTDGPSGDALCNGTVPGETCIAGACTHSHKPRAASLTKVRLAAARGLPPLPGDPDPPADLVGKPGFRIHWDEHANAIPETAVGGPQVVSFGTSADSRVLDPSCVGPNAQNYFDLKDANFGAAGGTSEYVAARRRIYHYAIATHFSSCPPDPATGGNEFCNQCGLDRGGGHPQAAASGTSEIPGNDFMISLGDRLFGLGSPSSLIPTEEGGTIMHELGHNLGLGHGVDLVGGQRVASLVPEYSPTYFSVMNYNYQFGGVLFATTPGSNIPSSSRLDYADDTVCADLVESSLVEAAGAQCGASSTRVVRFVPNTGVPRFASATTGTAVDWDGDGSISTSPIAADLNAEAGATETYYTRNEWAFANGKFTNLALDSFCSMWTVADGLAPALVLSEATTRAGRFGTLVR